MCDLVLVIWDREQLLTHLHSVKVYVKPDSSNKGDEKQTLTAMRYHHIQYRLSLSSTISGEKMEPLFRDLNPGFVKIHILYHAGIETIYGAWMQEELNRHAMTLPGDVILCCTAGGGWLSRGRDRG